jgi:nitrogen regulatory protein P-II 1
MKLIVAIIRPENLEATKTALDEPGLCLVSVGPVADGQALALIGTYRGGEVRKAQARVRLEIVAVNEALVPWAIEAITRAGSTSDARQLGQGNIYVVPLDECVRIPDGKARSVTGR